MRRILVALVLVLHGLIHVMGFAVYLQLTTIERLSYPTALLGGLLPAPAPVVALLGIVWLVVAVGFVVGGVALALDESWWRPLILATALGSVALCALGWPDARFGVFVDAAILAALLVWPHLGTIEGRLAATAR